MDERQRLILGSVIIPGLLLVAAWRWLRVSEIPTINAYRGDFTLKRAHAEYLQNAKGLIAEGIAKFNGPFRVVTTLGSRVILPSSFTEWVRTCDDLDHPKLVADEYFAYYPGFEGNKVVVDPSRMMINVTKTKLAQSSRELPRPSCYIIHGCGSLTFKIFTECELFNETISEMLEEEWADEKGTWKHHAGPDILEADMFRLENGQMGRRRPSFRRPHVCSSLCGLSTGSRPRVAETHSDLHPQLVQRHSSASRMALAAETHRSLVLARVPNM